MVDPLPRREFLRLAARLGLGGAAAVLAAGCQPVAAAVQALTEAPTFTPPDPTVLSPTATAVPSPQPTPTFAPEQLPGLVSPEEAAFLAGHEIWSGDETRPKIMMTYDDFGTEEQIDKILEAFRQVGGKATFFYLGDHLLRSARSIERIVAGGHQLGCHGYFHEQPLTNLSAGEVEAQFEQYFRDVAEIVPGYRVRFFRAPFGAINEEVRAQAARWGMQSVRWSFSSDGLTPKTRKIVQANASNGAIVLSHIYRYFDYMHADRITLLLVESGYQLVTVADGIKDSDRFTPPTG